MEATPYGSNSADSQQPGTPITPEAYSFSPDEQRVLRQCNAESFYQRCLPLGTFLGLGTHYAVKSGYLGAHPRFGSTPKVVISVIAGYFLGKLSYQQKCAEKLMALPGSRIGELLRQRRSKGLSENISLDPGFSAPMGLENTLPASMPELAPHQSYLDMDSDRPYITDFDKPPRDDSYDVSAIPVPPSGVPPVTSYDELRQRNREEYEMKRSKPYSMRPPADGAEFPPVTRARPPAPEHTPLKPKNKYGDEWEQ